jgi:UDPglucose 6-dehydrogenase
VNICVVGTGYVGLVSGTCFSEKGNKVTCVDLDSEKVENLKKGIIPIYEPGLEELVKKNINEKRLFFTTEISTAIKDAEVIFIAVGTPPKPNGEADLQYVENVARSVGKHIDSYKVIVTKSTVPVGTGKYIKRIIEEGTNGNVEFDVASNPEFLREGSALYDTFNMDRAVIGVESDKAAKLLTKLHEPFNTNIIVTNIETAEMIKYAANAFLATKISFINEIANLSEKVGADVTKIAEGIGMDKRIGKQFLNAGLGYGGSCFPKDVSALIQISEQHDYSLKILDAVQSVNNSQRYVILKKLHNLYKGHLKGKKIAILGLAFKPNTDDIRDAPSLDLIPRLEKEGAIVTAFDPIADENAKKIIPSLNIKKDIYETIEGSDAIVILTEWDEVRELDFEKVKSIVNEKVIIDGRNIFSLTDMKNQGFYYDSIGRQIIK